MTDNFMQISKFNRDLLKSLSRYDSLSSGLLGSNVLLETAKSSILAQIAQDKNLFEHMSGSLSKCSDLYSKSTAAAGLLATNKSLARFASSSVSGDESLTKAFVEQSGLEDLSKSLSNSTLTSQMVYSRDLARSLLLSVEAQQRLQRLETLSIGGLIGVSDSCREQLDESLRLLTSSYGEVVEALPALPENESPVLAKYSPVDYSLQLYALETISNGDVSEELEHAEYWPSIEDEIKSLDPELVRLVQGARQAMRSDNPDRVRHVTTSARELFTQLLHRLAPDEEIKAWSEDTRHYHRGRPTRRARLEYICRDFSCKPLQEFVKQDIKAILALVDALQSGTHSVAPNTLDKQLETIVLRIETCSLYLISISRNE